MAQPTCRTVLTPAALRPVKSGRVQHHRLPKAVVDHEQQRNELAEGCGQRDEERHLSDERRLAEDEGKDVDVMQEARIGCSDVIKRV